MKTSQFIIAVSAVLVAVASAEGVDKKESIASVSQQTNGAAGPSNGAKPADATSVNGPKNIKANAKGPADKKPQATGSPTKLQHQQQGKEKDRRNAKESMSAAPDSGAATLQLGASAALAGAAAILGTFF
ncbi:hypothetical protein GGI11_004754 [Coemansia sp. RSA 2049]|nr:hypothetical protein GGI11_004754 [Coemansia sp. RSA 2049]KAJ2518633.1 hypothetical protein H4217_003209 [Coemansia sp. RSA 1939]KAJ2608199.1 hypothetical protein EV177_005106 [Coemansia sp. RSA 1804]KAJ2681645.1 hypothetical protein GGH99_005099 [Coemansia sp. RSA 1285]